MSITQRVFHRLPISKKLIVLIWIFVSVVIALFAFSYETIFTLSATRAYVGGEGLWSKAQKEATRSLIQYAVSHAPADYQAYRDALATPLGDKKARLELEKANPDMKVVYEGFVQGRNRPEDVEGMAKLFRRFHHTKYMVDAVTIWAEADQLISQLRGLGEELNAEITSSALNDVKIRELTLKIEETNRQLTPLEDRFSYALGEGARWAAQSFLLVVALAVMLALMMGFALTLLMLKHVRKTDESYRHLIEVANDGIVLIDAKTRRLVEVNKKGLELIGIPKSHVIGKLGQTFCHPNSQKGFCEMIDQTAAGLNVAGKRLELLSSDGTAIEVEVNTGLAEFDEREVIHGILRDVRERKRLEEEVRQAQRMEVIGRLAGGLAHDFNNLLMIISTQLARIGKTDHIRLLNHVETIQSAVVKATSITRQLLAFGRKQLLVFEVIDMNDLVRGVRPILSALSADRVELMLELFPYPLPVRVDSGKIEQALFNLAINACDAMQGGGQLKLKTSRMDISRESNQREWAVLEVMDTGCGMDPETRTHVFEPFFTTKRSGEGSGLGLSIVYGILKQSGGSIEVQSEVGKGTTFRLHLPLVEQPPLRRPSPMAPAIQQSETENSETILLAEDQAAIRSALRDDLEAEGYTVLEAETGTDALHIAETFPGRIDALITDLIMPNMRGSALAREVTHLRSNTAVIFMSGYSEEVFIESGILNNANVNLIQKPFDKSVLSAMLRQVLDADRPDIPRVQ